MKITFILWGQLRTAAGHSQVMVEVENGETLRDAAMKLAGTSDDLARALLTEDGRLHSPNLAIVNGEKTTWDDETPLADGAEVSILTPIGGG